MSATLHVGRVNNFSAADIELRLLHTQYAYNTTFGLGNVLKLPVSGAVDLKGII